MEKSLPPFITLTVFFEGTANTLKSCTTQIGLFTELTDAIDLSDNAAKVSSYQTGLQYKIAFDGYNAIVIIVIEECLHGYYLRSIYPL